MENNNVVQTEQKKKTNPILIVLLVVLMLVGGYFGFKAGTKTADKVEDSVKKYETQNDVKKAYTIEKLATGETIYRNTEAIEILKVDADLSVINDRLNENKTADNFGSETEDDEYTTFAIENNTIVMEAKHYKFGSDNEIVKSKFIITAIKDPVSIYVVQGGNGGEDSYPVEFYVKNSEGKVYSVEFTVRTFDGYVIKELNEINKENITKYLVKKGNYVNDIYCIGLPCSGNDGQSLDDETNFKALYNNKVQCGYRGLNKTCEYNGEGSAITFVAKKEAFEAYSDSTECDASIATYPEKCINSRMMDYINAQLTQLKNVKDVNMDIDPELYRVIYIATEDGKLYYFVRETKENSEGIEEFNLIKVNTPLKFVEFVKNVDMSNNNKTKTKTIFKLSDGNLYYIDYNKKEDTISLNKYTSN